MTDSPREPTPAESAAEPRASRSDASAREAAPERFRWRLALGGVALLLLAGSPLWGPLALRRLAFFRVRNVEVVGARYLAPNDVITRLRVDTTASVWDAIGPLERRVASHPQVRAVEIERKLPGTLVVRIDERLPVALIPSPRGFRAFDARGVPLPIDLAKTPIDAPILADRDTAALRLLSSLESEAPTVYDRVSDVRPVSGDELVIKLDSLTLRTMKSVTPDRFYEIQPVRDDLARRQLKVVELDLRYRDQVIARIQ
jgi:cell division protein FtsQ